MYFPSFTLLIQRYVWKLPNVTQRQTPQRENAVANAMRDSAFAQRKVKSTMVDHHHLSLTHIGSRPGQVPLPPHTLKPWKRHSKNRIVGHNMKSELRFLRQNVFSKPSKRWRE